jgi:phosphatidylethanolamine-binding protein (PEBP) family uncharacterized protein
VGPGRAVLVAACAAAVAACGGDKETPAPEKDIPKAIALSSPDIKDGGAIPAELTCDGAGRRPTIVWRAAPAESIELVLVVDDPDAGDDGFTHWTVYNVSTASGAGLAPEGQFPTGFKEGSNSAGKTGWVPPSAGG